MSDESKVVCMQLISRTSRIILLAVCLFAGPACAALPDPIEFGWAVESNNMSKVTAWLDEGLDPEFQSASIGTGLMTAAWHGNIPMMALFIERGANPRRANKNGEQPLQLAAWNGHLEAVKWLLAHGAALNREGNYWGALHYAVFNGHTEMANYLIGRGAEVNARSPNGSTPLMMAAREGREDMTKVLLEAGGDPKVRNDWGDNALVLAMRYDHYRLGKMISSPEEFEIAVKAPKESYGEASRSASAPSAIDELLKKIREAEAAGRPTEALRKQLMEAVNTLRRSNSITINTSRRPMPLPYQTRSIVITAKRGAPGAERAQIVVDGQRVTPPAPAKSGAGSITITPSTPSKPKFSASQVADLMRQVRLAEAQGRPSEDLKKQLYEAVEQMR
jgi:hypothetical protein